MLPNEGDAGSVVVGAKRLAGQRRRHNVVTDVSIVNLVRATIRVRIIIICVIRTAFRCVSVKVTGYLYRAGQVLLK